VAVTAVNETSEGRTIDGNRDNTTVNRTFQVHTNDPLDGPYIVATASGIPRLLDTYESGNDSLPGSRCNNISATPVSGSRQVWTVTCQYETKIGKAPDPSALSIPWLAPAVYSYGGEGFQKIAERGIEITGYLGRGDNESGPLVNTAGFRFDPPVMIDSSLLVVSVEKAVQPTTSPIELFEYVDKVNKTEFLGFPRYSVKMRPFSYQSPVYSNEGIEYANLRLDFVVNPNLHGWKTEILSAGFMYRLNVDAPRGPNNALPINVPGIGIVQQPWPLNADGSQGKQENGDSPVYMIYECYAEAEFNNLPIF